MKPIDTFVHESSSSLVGFIEVHFLGLTLSLFDTMPNPALLSLRHEFFGRVCCDRTLTPNEKRAARACGFRDKVHPDYDGMSAFGFQLHADI